MPLLELHLKVFEFQGYNSGFDGYFILQTNQIDRIHGFYGRQ